MSYIVVKNPLIVMSENDDGVTYTCQLYRMQGGYEGYALLICDQVRHVARCFKVDEKDVFERIEKERHKPTTTITGETLRFREGGAT
jgi:hypothetical protein